MSGTRSQVGHALAVRCIVRLRPKLNGRSGLPVLFDNLIGLRVDLVFFGL